MTLLCSGFASLRTKSHGDMMTLRNLVKISPKKRREGGGGGWNNNKNELAIVALCNILSLVKEVTLFMYNL